LTPHEPLAKPIIAGRRREALEDVANANPGMTAHILDMEDPHAVGVFAAKVMAEIPNLNKLTNNPGVRNAYGKIYWRPRSISPTPRLRSGLFPIIADLGLTRQRLRAALDRATKIIGVSEALDLVARSEKDAQNAH
jgi:short-subunit dehydrogenase involved in D-alanine esterification of teichoic acids